MVEKCRKKQIIFTKMDDVIYLENIQGLILLLLIPLTVPFLWSNSVVPCARKDSK